ncbi:MAG: LysE family translocator [Candidatus Thiodiazotropha sp. (ex Codakia rugifera)]|nr:LysE family translocator [Candidatus Thiodiazotropha sp. (ex Codakia rugifera)]
MSTEFIITSLVIVLLPGTGVLFTISTGLFHGKRASLYAALGCTLGIIPHLIASILGLAAILHASAVAFQILKILGIIYLLYLAWGMWKESGELKLQDKSKEMEFGMIAVKAFLINILNPKLSLFFLAFLPQFVPNNSEFPIVDMAFLGAVFMCLTLVIFVIYGQFAYYLRNHIVRSPRTMRWIQRTFAGIFAFLALKLATFER